MLLLWVSYLARANIARLNLIFFTPDEVLAYAECILFTPDEVHILSIYSPLPNFFSPLPSCEPAKSITNLDMLGVTFDFSVLGELTSDEMVKQYSPTQELLWEFLAPKMLKKVGDEPHGAHSLLKRRIRDDLHEDSYEDEVGL